MNSKEELKLELETLINERKQLLKLAKSIDDLIGFNRSYQSWFTRSVQIVSTLASDRFEEFKSYYLIDPKRKLLDASNYVIQDYIKGISPRNDLYGNPIFDIHNIVMIRLMNQFHILESLSSRIEGVLAHIEGSLAADIVDAEIATAKTLKKTSLRAAGALAGVVLESHLQRVASHHGVKISKANPTVGDLNDPLKQAGVYDVPTWRKVQFLADIRNLCTHKKTDEPTKDQVDEMIDGVNWAVKNIL
ncbi:MAG: hypothetical protein JST85_16620 [Acidobacteria bacterium]|nr:hypothetical protein [Acidobacteriota bacterium]